MKENENERVKVRVREFLLGVNFGVIKGLSG